MHVIDYFHQDDDIWVGPWRVKFLESRRALVTDFQGEEMSIAHLGDRNKQSKVPKVS